MQNPCAFPATRKCLVCEFSSCNCQKCAKLRSERKPDYDEIKRCLRSSNGTTVKEADENFDNTVTETTNNSRKLAKAKLLGIQRLRLPSFNFTPSNLQSVLFDIVGIIAFFIMATVVFWVNISQYLWQFVQMVFRWERKAQLITLILLLLLCVGITFHAIRGSHHHQHKNQPVAKPSDTTLPYNSTSAIQSSTCLHKPCQRKRCSHFNLKNSNKNLRNCGLGSSENLLTPYNGNKFDNNMKTNTKQRNKSTRNMLDCSSSSSNLNLAKKQNPSLCDLCAQHMKQEVQPILSDDEARKMYKMFKLYAIPTEMKTPPSISSVVEILFGLYSAVSGSNSNTAP